METFLYCKILKVILNFVQWTNPIFQSMKNYMQGFNFTISKYYNCMHVTIRIIQMSYFIYKMCLILYYKCDGLIIYLSCLLSCLKKEAYERDV